PPWTGSDVAHGRPVSGSAIDLRLRRPNLVDCAKAGIGQAERFADALRDEAVELHAARHFNDPPEHVSRYAVLPCGAGLVGERKPAELADHLGIGLFFVGDACALIA